MKILVLNCGSSSLKYQLIDMQNEDVIDKGLCERIGIEGSRLKHQPAGKDDKLIERDIKDHNDAVALVMECLMDKDCGVIESVSDISAIGHRVVHGGEYFSESVVITDEVIKAIELCSQLAPLHNPPNLVGINACRKLMPNHVQTAVFDTAFHQTMPEKAYLYAIPYELYEKHKIRRYGFHGTSHKYVSERAAQMLGKKPEELNIITCHLGNGASVAAVKNGKVVDTSMGFTPLEGLIMGTRSGDIDPAAVTFIMNKENMTAGEVDNLLNKKSGVLGLSGVSSDFRDIENAVSEGNKRAAVTLEAFYYRVAKYIGEYAAAMNGVDAVVFTAGLGENSAAAREQISSYLSYLGAEVDKEKNNCRGREVDFAKDGCKLRLLVVPTNEELVIARDTKALL